ncbi:MAG TPA: type II toxin-antitoxin system RelE/ParE family toxin [Vitreimonas sp.]|uniref:type II toxin-antitoxin system RelE/ParE family toxin n=1 Tax=Vitreimonas sp. TaxID=3069702 RepID=UPI002D3C3E35|nr:type II toxin-antitoxin system RelE/ParE family toxin [Vitreimonas sp.]HYD89089.1 type II toxin-antitoxin system RelE/ParE family toxin [Vitreimonas sp.]
MDAPGHTVAETPAFIADCKDEGVSDVERAAIVNAVAANPKVGDLVQGSGGVFKRRFAGRGKGKSGGWRVMIAYVGEDRPAYLLALLGKGTRANFDADEIKAMRELTSELKKAKRAAKD